MEFSEETGVGNCLTDALGNFLTVHSVDDYEGFYRFVYRQAISEWKISSCVSGNIETLLLRVYWYVTGTMDEWDLDSVRARDALRSSFEKDKDLRSKYMAQAGGALKDEPPERRTPERVLLAAWERCLNDIMAWYKNQQATLEGMRRFYYAVRSRMDCIDVIEAGHWRVDMLHHQVDEKGLDVSLAVDMVTLAPLFDLAVVISGDADMLPSLRYCKQAGKHVSLVEFLQETPPEDHGRGVSSRLRIEADFVTRIYETELLQKSLAKRHLLAT